MKPFLVLVIWLACCPLSALTLVYTEQSDEREIVHTFVIEPAPRGYRASVSSQEKGGPTIFQTLQVDEGFSVLDWKYRDEAGGVEITATREGSVIRLAGLHRGRSVSRTFAVDDRPWYQFFPHGLEQWVMSGKQTVRFWAVGVEGLGAMRIGAFRATAGDRETIDWNGRRVEAVHVRIELPAFGVTLWSGDYWYRPEDGRNLVSRGDRGPGSRPIRVELTSER